jgi:GT2 family glycosyltransferase
MITKPTISVIVATFNRRGSLRNLLISLTHQTLPLKEFEVIVVSDGSTDGTTKMLEEFTNLFSPLKVLCLENRGPGAARNSGARVASGRYLAFTDDDCLATPTWLEEMVRFLDESKAVGIQGVTRTERAKRSPLSHQMEVLRPWLATVPTCNAAYLREVFHIAGGFDECFRYAHNEDADLAWRVQDFGQILFCSTAEVIHPPRYDTFKKCANSMKCLESEFLLFYKNPDKYRQYISCSPWVTIYWKKCIVEQCGLLKDALKYLTILRKPKYFIIGITLVLVRWMKFIHLLPNYWRGSRFYRNGVSSTVQDVMLSAKDSGEWKTPEEHNVA